MKPKSASDSEAKNGFRVPAKACSPAFYIYSIKVKQFLASKIVPVFGFENRSSFWLRFSVKFCGSLKSYPKKNSAGETRCRSHQSFLCTGTWCISGLGCATFCSSCCRKLCLQTLMGDFDAQAHTCSTTYFQPKMNVRGPSSWHHFLSKKCDRFRLHISSLLHASSMQRKVNPQARTVQGSRSGWQQAKPPRSNFNHRQARALE